MDQFSQLLVVGASGVLSHHLVFIRGEWHLHGFAILRTYSLIFMVLVPSEAKVLSCTITQAALTSSLLFGVHVACLFLSITIYRVFFHKLCKFPGPLLASISKLWHMVHTLDSQNHILLGGLRREYGDIVRTGPNEITVFEPNIFPLINGGLDNKFTKDAWYDLLLPRVSINTTRDKAFHDHRRRIWNYGFTNKALESYEAPIQQYADQLDRYVEKHIGQPINATQSFYWFSFDVMGQFAFSRSFGLLDNEQWDETVESMHTGMSLLGPLSPVPWLVRMILNVSFLPDIRKWNRMNAWIIERTNERLKMTVEKPDVLHYLIEWSKKNNSISADMHLLYGDASTLLVAGSETVASTLVYLFYFLALHPNHLKLVQAELSNVNVRDPKVLQSLEHLNGVINETLRLWPAVPTGGLRQVPPEGAVICGQFVPGGTTICAPRWSLSRLESCFERAEDFVPERWYSKPHMVKNKNAFAPFSIGRENCIGQKLAYVELRAVLALLASKYDFKFASQNTAENVINDTKDAFSIVPGPLDLIFERRKNV